MSTTTDPYPLEAGRKAIVTGAGSGFGRAIATELVDAGARVGLVDVNADALATVAAELGEAATPLPADVRNRAEVAEAIGRFATDAGGLDTLVISAGVIHIKPLGDVSEADWDLTLDVNLKGAFLTAQAAAPHLAESGRGRIVTISSDAGRRGAPGIAAYAASKFGLIGLTESLAMELAAEGVTANAVCPVGCPTTEMGQGVLAWKIGETGKAADEIVAAAGSSNPIGRNATEADITAAVMFFLAPGSSFFTGVSLDVDGGLRMGSAKLPGT
jgi:NAD(P)-dependent dehydrogenase (short-subunit alcohol dehydrogenase family)